ncbi:bifunctional phosphoglucose/phosphomannose isomerase [Candidatus Woesearchaeota archaeon]|nr:bifunctional phosphoglucose/phosphomannose isomerase [Candidatus Woesearchaeota archaeon]
MAEDELNVADAIAKYDPENMRQAILSTPDQSEQGYKLVEALDLSRAGGKYHSVIIAGMGGSAIAGLLLQNFLSDEPLRIVVVQDYSIPKWVDKHTLVIACSYSGNTEETLSAYKEARRKGCDVIVVTTGGKIEEYARVSKLIIVNIPTGYQPRAAMTIQFFAMLRILEKLRLVESKAKDVLKLKDDLKAQLTTLEKNAIILSEKLAHKTPLVYSSKRFEAIAYRWKCQFNENSKTMAFYHFFSEMNHNEIQAFINPRGNYHAIILRFDEDHRRVHKRMTLTKEIMLKGGVSATEIGIRGTSLLSKMFSAIILGDLASFYLAMRLRTDPSVVDLIEDFKNKLGPYVA